MMSKFHVRNIAWADVKKDQWMFHKLFMLVSNHLEGIDHHHVPTLGNLSWCNNWSMSFQISTNSFLYMKECLGPCKINWHTCINYNFAVYGAFHKERNKLMAEAHIASANGVVMKKKQIFLSKKMILITWVIVDHHEWCIKQVFSWPVTWLPIAWTFNAAKHVMVKLQHIKNIPMLTYALNKKYSVQKRQVNIRNGKI